MTDVRDKQVAELARTRILAQKDEIEHSLRQIAAGNPLGAEVAEDRSISRIAVKSGMSLRDSEAIAGVIASNAAKIDETGAEGADGPEALQGPTIDFVGVDFLLRGRHAANAVGRVVFSNGRAQGTGFLVAPGLFITNNHVIRTPEDAGGMKVQFDYEADEAGNVLPVTAFAFDARACFVSDPVERLDFTLIALGPRLDGNKDLGAFGYIPLSDAGDKHMLGELANIIQHPKGALKQLVVRENNLVSRDETNQVLHYLADTEKGSSGSPVCNNEWEPIAIHHWGGPSLEITGADGKRLRNDINEGVRISAVVKSLRARVASLQAPHRQAVSDALALWDSRTVRGPVAPESATTPVGTGAPHRNEGAGGIGADGSVTWVFPIEISVRAPLVAGARPAVSPAVAVAEQGKAVPPAPGGKEKADQDFSTRGGYEPGFIPGFVVPMPDTRKLPYQLARNRQAEQGDDPHELRYHHFSIVMNASRRLAAFTACNIDGKRVVSINRRTKEIDTDPTPGSMDLESLGAESSDDFLPDERIDASEQMAVEFYEEQDVPGFPKPPFPGKSASADEKKVYARAMANRTGRMLQKGHIIMRSDPSWGTPEEALAAEQDTFFYTNAAPQIGFFNQGSPENRPGMKGKLRWRTVETYVLRNALTMRQRVCVFAGPVFDDAYDLDYRMGSKLPMRFWKIAVWAEEGILRSVALLADQKPAIERLTKGVPEGMGRAEAFGDVEELARVSEFLTTVAEIERRTHLDFGAAVRQADIRGTEGNDVPAIDATSDTLRPRSPGRPPASRSVAKTRRTPPLG